MNALVIESEKELIDRFRLAQRDFDSDIETLSALLELYFIEKRKAYLMKSNKEEESD